MVQYSQTIFNSPYLRGESRLIEPTRGSNVSKNNSEDESIPRKITTLSGSVQFCVKSSVILSLEET